MENGLRRAGVVAWSQIVFNYHSPTLKELTMKKLLSLVAGLALATGVFANSARAELKVGDPAPTGDHHQRMPSYGYGYGMRLA